MSWLLFSSPQIGRSKSCQILTLHYQSILSISKQEKEKHDVLFALSDLPISNFESFNSCSGFSSLLVTLDGQNSVKYSVQSQCIKSTMRNMQCNFCSCSK
jgi:hypothetical protein